MYQEGQYRVGHVPNALTKAKSATSLSSVLHVRQKMPRGASRPPSAFGIMCASESFSGVSTTPHPLRVAMWKVLKSRRIDRKRGPRFRAKAGFFLVSL